ncbi:DNA ligase 4-like protein [Drosera capensis]
MYSAVKFSVLTSLFEWTQKSKSPSLKRSKFRKFLDHFCSPDDYFDAIRLVLPSLDRERGSYGLKESTLATCIVDALCVSREAEDAVRLINWRKGGVRVGYNVGNFAGVAAEVLQRRQGIVSGGLTIREINDLLDRLASSESRQVIADGDDYFHLYLENRSEKTSVLGDLIRKTNAQEMKWIVMIILKDLKLGVSEKSIFHEFHPDAEDLFNVTCDLKLVCEKLKDRSQRHKRQDIEVGKAIRPQLAMRVSNAAAAWKKALELLHGKEVVVECKFDGDRIQIHKNGADIHFFSRQLPSSSIVRYAGLGVLDCLAVELWESKGFIRTLSERSYSLDCLDAGGLINLGQGNCVMVLWKLYHVDFSMTGNFHDHPEYGHAMSNIVMDNVLEDRCILDGEMLVWDTLANRFAEFGSNQEIAKAAREGLDSDRQFDALHYNWLDVAFDILYAGDTSVIHQTLKERQEILRKVVKPLKGRFEILVPSGGLNKHRSSGESCWSLIARNVDDVERFFKDTIENRDEGIVVKDLGSRWEPGDRSGKWMKLKPEYVRAGSDLDVLIIGGYYGSGRFGGEVAQFLMGLAESSPPNSYPRRFISFCRVGTGLSDEERDELVTKLKPYFRKSDSKKGVPSFYQVTNNSKERPDVWIESPEKSIILSITSDIRTIRTEVFAAPYSLRFPRIDRVRYDKPWHECLDVQYLMLCVNFKIFLSPIARFIPAFIELVHSSNGTTQRRADDDIMLVDKPKRVKSSKREAKKKLSLVPSHFVPTDISMVKGESLIFSDLVFYFINVPPGYSLDMLHKMVSEYGGTFSMNLNDKVTHCIAAESKGIKYEAAKRNRDVIHYSWLLDCCSKKKILPLQPKYFLFLSGSSRKKLQDKVDDFLDFYFCDVNVGDLKQVLNNATRSEDTSIVEYYKRKCCPDRKWCLFSGCCIYFHFLPQLRSPDWDTILKLASRRMGVDVSVGGGKVSRDLSQATHMVVVSVPGSSINFETLLKSFPSEEMRVLCKKRLRMVRCQWLEDCLADGEKISVTSYSLKPSDLEESLSDDECKVDACSNSASPKHEAETEPTPPARGQKLVMVNREPKRKDTRSAETGAQKRKLNVRQPTRTRARLASRAAKLHEDESDETFLVDQVDQPKNEVTEAHDSDHTYENTRPEVLHQEAFSPDETGAQKRKLNVRQPTRTRARLASRAAKLHEDESDETFLVDQVDQPKNEVTEAHDSDHTYENTRPEVLHQEAFSPDETGAQKRKLNVRQPTRTRARLASGAAKLHEDESDETFLVDQLDQPKNEVTEALDSDHTYENRLPEVLHQEAFSPARSNVQSEPNPNIHADEKTNHELSDNAVSFEPDSNRVTSPSEKLEIMVDPVHAMLLDMIPSLGLKKVESSIPVGNCQTSATDVPKANPSVGEAGEQIKKKKRVSYKDMANELLKDW